MKATAKDLRFHSKELLEAASRGEEVIITYRGKPKAKLVAIGKPEGRTHHLFGMWKDREDMEDVGSYVRNLRNPRLNVD